MKKFSTQVLALALALLPAGVVTAQSTPPLQLAKDAPDKHVVVKGDTLWGIAGKFLDHPWRWPEVWELNREQIRNPHLIYPGEVVYLDTSGASPRLRLGKQVDVVPSSDVAQSGQPAERVQPRVRAQATEPAPIPTVDAASIAPFLTRPLVVDAPDMATHPQIVATQDGRVYLGRGDLAYVRGLTAQEGSDWFVYRSANPLFDPDTRQPIAWEAQYVGTARLERNGDPATIRMLSTNGEVGPGDRLMPVDPARPFSFAPKPPQTQVNGRILSVYRGVAQAGRGNVVAMSAGAQAGLAVGDVLAIKQRGRVVPGVGIDKLAVDRQWIQLPDEQIGHLLVFRVFDKISYGLIMKTSRAVSIGDDVSNP